MDKVKSDYSRSLALLKMAPNGISNLSPQVIQVFSFGKYRLAQSLCRVPSLRSILNHENHLFHNFSLQTNYPRRALAPYIAIQRIPRIDHQRRQLSDAAVIDLGVVGDDDDAIGGFNLFVSQLNR